MFGFQRDLVYNSFLRLRLVQWISVNMGLVDNPCIEYNHYDFGWRIPMLKTRIG